MDAPSESTIQLTLRSEEHNSETEDAVSAITNNENTTDDTIDDVNTIDGVNTLAENVSVEKINENMEETMLVENSNIERSIMSEEKETLKNDEIDEQLHVERSENETIQENETLQEKLKEKRHKRDEERRRRRELKMAKKARIFGRVKKDVAVF